MDYQRKSKGVTVRTVDGFTFSGTLNLGINERLSEVFTKEEKPFIVLWDVTFDRGKGGTGKVLFVNKRNIVWAEPEE
ncbi:MAG: hypothetical protein JRJ42_07660 [Deltaproteobacteria bacterium]|nr:hypothetical protein [Deltaproteobacteria bacterium]MBW2019217.1 hypothetical protein [Deltaproteobacteria bacterium]MBW2074023.1 hypothetical protein [Deltaproteobacteria bacterium]RLB80372.1 MAG: hypothetical protein DRH17_12125 [Deltaproteobacteria bacterium]